MAFFYTDKLKSTLSYNMPFDWMKAQGDVVHNMSFITDK